MSLKATEYFFLMANRLDPDETPNYSASHPVQSYLHITFCFLLLGKGLTIPMQEQFKHAQSFVYFL